MMPQYESAAEPLVDAENEEMAVYIGESIIAAVEGDRVQIPPFPAVAMQVRDVLQRPDYGLNDLAKVVLKDQALVAVVLKMANSSFYGGASKVSSLNGAIGRIGATQLQRVILAASLGAGATKDGPLSTLRTAVWRDALVSAHLCQTLAHARGVDGETAFICGMLHDFGVTLALACAEDFLVAWPDPTPMPVSFWSGVVEQHHVLLGVRLVERWGLEETLKQAIQDHHENVDSPSPLVEIVRASDAVIKYLSRVQAPRVEDYAALPGVRGPAEAKLIAKTIGDILAAVASYQVEPRKGGGSPPIQIPHTTLKGLRRPASFAVRVVTNESVEEYTALEMTSTGVSFEGGGVVAMNSLVRVELDAGDHKATIWANVGLCVAERGKWRIEVAPVALTGTDRLGWNAIFMSLDTNKSNLRLAPAPSPAPAAPDAAGSPAAAAVPKPAPRPAAVPAAPPAPAEQGAEDQKKKWWKPW